MSAKSQRSTLTTKNYCDIQVSSPLEKALVHPRQETPNALNQNIKRNTIMPQNTDYNKTASGTKSIGYKKRLSSWAIARLLPDTQQEIVSRFRSRSDAEGHMRLLSQMNKSASFIVVFDCQREEAVI